MPQSKPMWKMKDHTVGKHQILENYLGGWLPILGRTFKRLVYIDGFAGPGEYENGEIGSPLIALNRIERYQESDHSKNVEVVCLFLEEDAGRANNLQSKLSGINRDRIKIHVENDTFERGVTNVLNRLDRNAAQLAPSFTMIDPFGIKGVRMQTIGRILKHPRSECMVTFMDESITRFKATSEFQPHLMELFGTDDFDMLNPTQEMSERFASRLKEEGAKYVLPFKIWRRHRHIYTIFFATKNLRGCDLMKSCMWKVDGTGRYSYRDVYSNSSDLFQQDSLNIVMEPFLKDLMSHFGTDRWVRIEEIEEFAQGDETIYYTGQLKDKTLKPAEDEGRIQVSRPQGNRGFTRGKNVTVKFIR